MQISLNIPYYCVVLSRLVRLLSKSSTINEIKIKEIDLLADVVVCMYVGVTRHLLYTFDSHSFKNKNKKIPSSQT